MKNKLFFGGFPYETTEAELAELFGTCGTVLSLKVLMERGTGRSRGLGFVEMSTEEEARAAMEKLDGSAVGERKMFVAEARPMDERPAESFGAPGFVERRSGRDRRQSQGTPAAAKPAWAPSKKKWGDKPGGFSKKRPWERKPESRFAKKGGFGSKPWGPRREGGSERTEGFGPRKWERKPGGFVGKKPWPKPEGGSAGKKPWGAKPGFGPKKFGRKPGGFARGRRSGAGPGE